MALVHVVPAGSDEHRRLLSDGWVVTHRSFGAQLDADRVERAAMPAVAEAVGSGIVRELGRADLPAVLALDTSTLDDYPGGTATRHRALTEETARPTEKRRAFGIVTAGGEVVAMTYIDIDGTSAETDFTVVHREWRGRGFARAVKAASILALLDSGVQVFRTGGSFENAGIRSANTFLGYREDEEWVTLEKPGGSSTSSSSS